MKKRDAIRYFGTQIEVAKVLKISRQAVQKWPDVIPLEKAVDLQALTGGALKVKHELYRSLRTLARISLHDEAMALIEKESGPDKD